MNKEAADKWVEALRSGKYKQTRGALRRAYPYQEGFCCLGVKCDLIDDTLWELGSDSRFRYGERAVDSVTLYLPPSAINQDNFLNRNPFFSIDIDDHSYQKVYLASLNDCGFTFDQIADCIEFFYREL